MRGALATYAFCSKHAGPGRMPESSVSYYPATRLRKAAGDSPASLLKKREK